MKRKYIFFFLLISISLYLGVYLVAFVFPKLEIPKVNSYYLYDVNDEIYRNNNDDWISLDKISDNLKNATIAVEDKHFYNHQGFDYLRIFKALVNNIMTGSVSEGASTITQQYAKNLYLSFDKKLSRKIEEAWLTLRLETHYSKDEILEGYLNTINYGGVFGIENASEYYFGKSASDLTLAEATILAGIPKSPSNYEPINNSENSKNRQKTVLQAMVNNKYISSSDMDNAYNEELTYVTNNDKTVATSTMYYQDAVLAELKNINTIPNSLLTTGGLKIYTNLDNDAQLSLENAIKTNVNEQDMQASSILMNPDTGQVLGLVGGKNYDESQYNRALYAKRQVGSTMKPILYYAALENGMTATSMFKSEKTTFAFASNDTYTPQNFGDKYPNKDITMIEAVATSDNVFAVKTHLFLGEDTLVNTAHTLGITSNLEAVPSLALGSEEISLMEMVSAYATFANEGYKIEPYFIRKVEDGHGNVLYERSEKKDLILNKSNVFILNDLLTSTYDAQLIDYEYPTCYVIKNRMTHKYSVKTGTTDSDYLIFGYNKNAIVGVWAGYDDNREVPNNGGYIVKNTWVDSIEGYLKGKKTDEYTMPDDVVGVLVNPLTGEKATNESEKKRIVYYLKGTEPQ